MQTIGLQLKPEETYFSNISQGFDFLDFNIKKYTINQSTKILIKPSKESQKKLVRQIRAKLWHKDKYGRTRNNTYLPLSRAIYKINPIIEQWAEYFQYVSNNKTFRKLDWTLNEIIYRWQTKKYKKAKTVSWNKYCIKIINNKKRISQGEGILTLLSNTKINKYERTILPSKFS